MAIMDGHLVTLEGQQLDFTEGEVERLLASSKPFWLDLCATPEGSAHDLLRSAFNFHPLALEDAEHFGQRPKLDSYDDFALLVVYGLSGTGQLVEVHCFCAQNFLVTVHHEACPGFTEVLKRIQMAGAPPTSLAMVLYRVVDVLVDGFFPVLASFDDRIDELEDDILKAPTEAQLGQLFDMKRSLIALRKIVTPERDVFATLIGNDVIPGMTPDCERYFRDVYDHLIRVSDLVDSYRDLMSGALDTHLSTVSNRLNLVMKQLTVIATIFLPLSFLTGFFGQNFGWLVARIGGFWIFLSAGVGLDSLAVVGLWVMFRRRGWLTSDANVPAPRPSQRVRLAPHLRWSNIHIPRPQASAEPAPAGQTVGPGASTGTGTAGAPLAGTDRTGPGPA
jgi:magnesium transporter